MGAIGIRHPVYWAVLAAAVLFAATVHAVSPTRLAVVFVNARYLSLGELRNPTQDGQLVASALRSAGFDVVLRHDLDDEGFRTALRQLAKDSARYDVTLVYYAGHGVQLSGTNYLLPVDIKTPEQAEDIRLGSVSADEVLSVIKSRYRILVLDACRENPALGRALSKGRGTGYKQGLAPVSPQSELDGGVFIAYSTQADAVAQDGEGANSPFAESFAKHLGENASIDDMFALVTRDVLQATKGFQRPFKYASMDTVFCLSGNCGGADSFNYSEASHGGAPVSDVQQLTKSLRQLESPKAEMRASAEQTLAEELRPTLPKTVPYGYSKDKDGVQTMFAFDPASVHNQGDAVAVTIRTFNVGEHGKTTETGWVARELVECKSHRLIQKDWQMNGTVKLYTLAEQKANAIILEPGSVGEGLEGALCTSLRFVPLWAVPSLEWQRIGPTAELSQETSFEEPTGSDVHYVLGRVIRNPPDTYGGDINYGWLGINCGTHEFSANTGYSLKTNGTIQGVYGNAGKWQHIDETSAANNAYVLLCDKPQ